MYKVKDLATICVDNAFRTFPVDAERYELLVSVENWVRSLNEDNSPFLAFETVPVACASGPCFEFFVATLEHAFLGASALKLVLTYGEKAVSRPTLDRARRFSAACAQVVEMDAGFYYTAREERLEKLILVFWSAWSVVARATRGFVDASLSSQHGGNL